MTAEEQAAATERYSTDTDFLRRVGIALEFEAKRRRDAGEPPLTNTAAAEFVAALPE
jgi:hypothetical protein